ncbi:hypothetical protein JTB14_020850 [Gonioctena quinquepunctata]|nr:hypothetical protein JTB14_020850 [Gonioctena quinquepunctata]
MKAVSNISWGMDREILLKMYNTLILSIIDYGCVVYGAARKSHLKQLDSIQGTGSLLVGFEPAHYPRSVVKQASHPSNSEEEGYC